VVATALRALKFFRKGNDLAAAGFVVFAIGEGVMLVGTATTLAASVPSFAAGTALWSAALLLTSIPPGVRELDTSGGHNRCNSVCRHIGKNPLGGTDVTNLLAIALLCIPVPRAYFCGLDLECVERGFKDIHCFNTQNPSMSAMGCYANQRLVRAANDKTKSKANDLGFHCKNLGAFEVSGSLARRSFAFAKRALAIFRWALRPGRRAMSSA